MKSTGIAIAILAGLGAISEKAWGAGPQVPKPAGVLQAQQPLRGKVAWIDRQVVWINLGSADGVKNKAKFAVADRADDEAVKGHIEVTRLLGPHLSEARILDQEARRPIGKDDPVLP